MAGNDHDITILNTLTTTTIDSANGFERSAENVDSPRFRSMFEEFGRERREVVGRLQERVRQLGGTPNDDGSMKADLHRRWEDMRKAIAGGDDKQVIEEVERGEDYIKEKYETALRDDELSPETRTLIQECFVSIRRGHDRASELKHGMQAASA